MSIMGNLKPDEGQSIMCTHVSIIDEMRANATRSIISITTLNTLISHKLTTAVGVGKYKHHRVIPTKPTYNEDTNRDVRTNLFFWRQRIQTPQNLGL